MYKISVISNLQSKKFKTLYLIITVQNVALIAFEALYDSPYCYFCDSMFGS